MGKSKATQRIERIMTQLRMQGKLDKPYYPNGKPTAPRTESPDCCVRTLSRLPDGVVSCPDCPLDLRPEVR